MNDLRRALAGLEDAVLASENANARMRQELALLRRILLAMTGEHPADARETKPAGPRETKDAVDG